MNHQFDRGIVRLLTFHPLTCKLSPVLPALVLRLCRLSRNATLVFILCLASQLAATPGFAGSDSASAYESDCHLVANQSAVTNNANATTSSLTLEVLANDFPALHAVTQSMQECSPPELTIKAEHTKEFRQLQIPALQSDPAAFDVVMTGNNAIVPLLNEGLLQPLDEAIDRIAPQLPDNLKIRFDGKTYAVALLANTQHLFVREDLLQKAGLKMPETYTEILEVCSVLQQAGLKHPYGAAYKAGWDLALEFINIYLAFGGTLGTDNKLISIDPVAARKSLLLMKKMTACMTPDYLSSDINEVQRSWQAGDHAMALFWGSRATAILDDPETPVTIKSSTRLTAAPAIARSSKDISASGPTAATLWWVGFAIPRNTSQAKTDAALELLIDKTMPQLIRNHSEKAVWMIPGYSPDINASGVKAVIDAGAPAYPSSASIGLFHAAAGEEIADFLKSAEPVETTIKDIDANYRTRAKAKGFVEKAIQ